MITFLWRISAMSLLLLADMVVIAAPVVMVMVVWEAGQVAVSSTAASWAFLHELNWLRQAVFRPCTLSISVFASQELSSDLGGHSFVRFNWRYFPWFTSCQKPRSNRCNHRWFCSHRPSSGMSPSLSCSPRTLTGQWRCRRSCPQCSRYSSSEFPQRQRPIYVHLKKIFGSGTV